MQENSQYAVGLDIGSTTVRCVVAHLDSSTGHPSIVGVGTAPNSGMRKGAVVNLNGPGQAIDTALGEAERMSGYEVNDATISINGVSILSTKADGMIAVSGQNQSVTSEDIHRLEEVATVGKIPANREILDIVPHSYRLDGQGNIKDPIDMTGTRLEVSANVVSVLSPVLSNLEKAAESASVRLRQAVPSAIAAARAVLSEAQCENGVALVDIGGATTSVAVYEEGDLQHLAVIPLGGNNITNDLAIGLKIDPEVAEKVKLTHADALADEAPDEEVKVTHEETEHVFSSHEIDEIIGARLDEIFEHIQKELKRAGRAGKLPSGVVLVGGSAQIAHLDQYAKTELGVAARLGVVSGFGGVADSVESPDFATVVGLMLTDSHAGPAKKRDSKSAKKKLSDTKGTLAKFFDRFRA